MVRHFTVPDLLSDDLTSAASEAFRNPRVLLIVEQALIDRRSELVREANKFARAALTEPGHAATALRFEGRLAEVESILEKITRWKE